MTDGTRYTPADAEAFRSRRMDSDSVRIPRRRRTGVRLIGALAVPVLTLTAACAAEEDPKQVESAIVYHAHDPEKIRQDIQALYESSTAVIADSPFAIELPHIQEKKERYQHLRELSRAYTEADLSELKRLSYEIADAEVEYTASQKIFEENKTRYSVSFAGGVATSSGMKLNFWQIAGETGKTIQLDPKAIDAHMSWVLNNIDDYGQALYEYGDGNGLEKVQELANSNQLGRHVVNIFVNPDSGECFTNDAKIVKEDDISCENNGSETSLGSNYFVKLTSKDDAQVVPTEYSPYIPSTVDLLWRSEDIDPGDAVITEAKPTNVVLLHELSHVFADIAGTFGNDYHDGPFNGTYIYSREHYRWVHPVMNAYTAFGKDNQRDGIRIPFPIHIVGTPAESY